MPSPETLQQPGGYVESTARMRVDGFVGRAAELSVIAELIEVAHKGTGGVVLLAGPAGIGKSTLAEEAIRRYAEPAGWTRR